MGSKLEKTKNIVREGKETSIEARNMGQKAIEQLKQMAAISDSLPDDVDDDVRTALEDMKDDIRESGVKYIEDVVGDRAREAQEKLGEAQAESREQMEKNREAQSGIERMESISKFGETGRNRAISDIRRSTEQFGDIANEAQEVRQETEEMLKQQTAQAAASI